MPEPASESLTVEAVVEEALPNAMYRVRVMPDGRASVTVHVAGTSGLLRVLPGDAVAVELSPYDTTRGRIVRRRT